MADLDTRSKRASSVNVLKPWTLALVLPDGAIGQADRQHSAWAYAGILASGGAALPTVGNGERVVASARGRIYASPRQAIEASERRTIHG